MLKVFSIIFFLMIVGLPIHEIYAAQYNYNQSALSISWTSVTGPVILLDTDGDNIIDTGYHVTGGNSLTLTFTKDFGSGLSSFTKTFTGVLGNAGSGPSFGVYKDRFIVVGYHNKQVSTAAVVTASLTTIDIFTGGVNQISSISGGGGADTNNDAWTIPDLMNRTDNKIVFLQASARNSVWTYQLQANATTLTSVGTASHSMYKTMYGAWVDWTSTTIYRPKGDTVTGTLNGNLGYVYNNTAASNAMAQVNMGTGVSYISENATLYYNGITHTRQTALGVLSAPTWSNIFGLYMPTTIDASDKIFYLNYKILDSSFSAEPYKIKIKIGGVDYIGLTNGSTLKYAVIPDLSDRAYQTYLLDSYTPVIGTQVATTALPSQSITLVTPTGNTNIASVGLQSMISGYEIQPVSIDRTLKPSVTDTLDIYPVSIPPTSGLTAVSVLVKNAPTDGIVKIENPSASFLGHSYLWATKFLTADNSFSVDLPTNHCFVVELAQGDVITKIFTSLGQLCASGTMPKTITYTTNLAFTFWTLTWGTSHLYDQSTQNLQTMVRHKTQPFSYTVNVIDKNGTTLISNSYTSNTTGIDLHTFNTTGIDKPARVEILDDANKTLYFASLGYPSYLSGVSAWFIEWLTHDGFSLIAMLPIIFSAMFTRNTVGIGTCLTVAFIATMVWVGLLAIPEIALYALMFIAAIGVVAYKTLS